MIGKVLRQFETHVSRLCYRFLSTHSALPLGMIAKGITMKLILCVLLIGVSLIWTGISKADAQTARSPQNCGPRDAVLKRLAKSYGEVQQSQGLGANNAIIEVFASSTTGSWTITVTMPTGLTCLVASGQAYKSLAKNDPKIGDDT